MSRSEAPFAFKTWITIWRPKTFRCLSLWQDNVLVGPPFFNGLLSPKHEMFLGCEFKRLFFPTNVSSMMNDLERLRTFRLVTDFPAKYFGKNMKKVVKRCHKGFGLVGGLHWLPASNESSEILNIWERSPQSEDYPNLSEAFESLDAHTFAPQFVLDFPKGGRYYLLAVMFQITPYNSE